MNDDDDSDDDDDDNCDYDDDGGDDESNNCNKSRSEIFKCNFEMDHVTKVLIYLHVQLAKTERAFIVCR